MRSTLLAPLFLSALPNLCYASSTFSTFIDIHGEDIGPAHYALDNPNCFTLEREAVQVKMDQPSSGVSDSGPYRLDAFHSFAECLASQPKKGTKSQLPPPTNATQYFAGSGSLSSQTALNQEMWAPKTYAWRTLKPCKEMKKKAEDVRDAELNCKSCPDGPEYYVFAGANVCVPGAGPLAVPGYKPPRQDDGLDYRIVPGEYFAYLLPNRQF